MTTLQPSQVLEEALGQPVEQVDWRKRMKEGVVVTLTVKRWRARQKIKLAELGILPSSPEVREAYADLVNLGTKLLLPLGEQQALDAVERVARLHLAEHAYNTPFGLFLPYTTYRLWMWGLWRDPDDGRTIPGDEYDKKYGQWNDGRIWKGDTLPREDHMVKPGNTYYQAKYFDQREQVVSRYDQLQEELLAQYRMIARKTYQLLLQQDQTFLEMQGLETEEQFIAHFETSIRMQIKSASDFAKSFVYDWTIERVKPLTTLEAESEEITDDVITTEMREQQAQETAFQERKRLLSEMNRDLMQKARTQKAQMIDSFFSSIVAQLRQLVYEAVTTVLVSIRDQETLQGRPVIQLKNLIEQLEQLNFYGDRDIDDILVMLHGIVEKPARERDISEISRQLRTIGTLVRGTVLALGEQPRAGRDDLNLASIGIVEDPEESDLREARLVIDETVSQLTHQESPREERVETYTLATGSDSLRGE